MRLLTCIERRLIRDLLVHWLVVTGLVTATILVNKFVSLLRKAAEGGLPVESVLPIVGFRAIPLAVLVLPAGLYLGALWVLLRMARDNELTVLRACGVSPLRWYRPLLVLLVPGVIAVTWASLVLSPDSTARYYEARYEAERRVDVSILQAGQFHGFQNDDIVFFLGELNRESRRMEDIFARIQAGGQHTIEVARAAYQGEMPGGGRALILEQGRLYALTDNGTAVRQASFDQQAIRLPAREAADPRTRIEAKPTGVLLAQAGPEERAEFHRRLAIPCMTLVLGLWLVPLTQTVPRSSRAVRIVPAILIYLIYANLLSIAGALVERGVDPWGAGVFGVHGLMAGIAVVAALLSAGWRLPTGLLGWLNRPPAGS